ncbi:MAG TPA: hypothetical protein PKX16_05875, partial [Kiritimatiellia bacterium]|nr:hypothetical protein [Kiritimatiellia bacterium]
MVFSLWDGGWKTGNWKLATGVILFSGADECVEFGAEFVNDSLIGFNVWVGDKIAAKGFAQPGLG